MANGYFQSIGVPTGNVALVMFVLPENMFEDMQQEVGLFNQQFRWFIDWQIMRCGMPKGSCTEIDLDAFILR